MAMGWILHSGTYRQMHMRSCGYAPLCQAPKTVASQGPERVTLIHYRKPPSTLDRGPRFLPWVHERVGRGRQVVKSRPLTLIIEWRSDGMDNSQD
jgi:hypothetical protein